MINGGKLKIENNANNEACDDDNFDVQSTRQARGINLFLFYNDRSSAFSKNAFGIDIAVVHTGT